MPLENSQRDLWLRGQEGCDWTVYDKLVAEVRRLRSIVADFLAIPR